MAFCTMYFFGDKLGKMNQMNIILPQGEGPYPVLYLLHGYSDDHSAWCRRSSIERYVMDRDLIVAMPNGDTGFYLNDPRPNRNRNFEDHIVEDVVGFMDKTFPTIADRTGRAIAGLSMGGYGAMLLGLKHADTFCSISSLSGALMFGTTPKDFGEHKTPEVEAQPELATIQSAVIESGQYNCLTLADEVRTKPNPPAIRFDCGVDDFLIESNRTTHAHFEKIGLEHTYKEFPGEHSWSYWDEHLPETIDFAMEHFGK